jgi:processive 1,2-diacylglycerol beta-glucosyltransferase
LTERYPTADIRCVDALDHTPPWFRAFYAWSYLSLVQRLPQIWRVSYRFLDWAPGYRVAQPLRRRWNLWIARPFVTWLKATRPDLVVATHFLAADVCSAGKAGGWLSASLVVVVTDLYPHRFWISAEPDAIIVATPESGAVLTQRGVASGRVQVLGIPIGSGFNVSYGRRDLERLFGLVPNRRTVLVTSGGTTVGSFERVVEALLQLEEALPGRLQLLVICGHNAAAVRRLQGRARRSPMPMQVVGFIDTMPQAMAASDLLVGKAGGLTIAEALARGIPLVLYHVIPGQERLNAEYTARHGAAIIASRPAEVAIAVRRVFEDPGRLEAMRRAAQLLSRPNAAGDIVSKVLQPLLDRGSDA